MYLYKIIVPWIFSEKAFYSELSCNVTKYFPASFTQYTFIKCLLYARHHLECWTYAMKKTKSPSWRSLLLVG